MKTIYVGLVACALLLAMTGVVSACCGEYDCCKVNGGGQVYDACLGDITVTYHAMGTCESCKTADDGVKGKVNIVYHDLKKKLKLDVEVFDCGFHEKNGVYSYYANLRGSDADGEWCLSVVDNGEGSKATPDTVSFTGYLDCSYKYFIGFNSKATGHNFKGNVQVSGKTLV